MGLHSSAWKVSSPFSLCFLLVVSCPTLEGYLQGLWLLALFFSVSLSCELYSQRAAWNPTLVPQAPQPQHLKLSFHSSSAQQMTDCLPSCSNQRSILPSFLHSSLIQSSSSAKMLLSLPTNCSSHHLLLPPTAQPPPGLTQASLVSLSPWFHSCPISVHSSQ